MCLATRPVILLVIGLWLAFGRAAAARGAAPYRMEGVVTEQETGKPLAGAKVRVVIASESEPEKRLRTATSDDQGRYSVELPIGHAWEFGILPPPGYVASKPNDHEVFATTRE